MTKRLFLIISALIISLGFCTYGSEFWIDNVKYEIIDSTERLVAAKGCKDKDKGLYIPEKVEYNGVEFSVVEIKDGTYEVSNYVVIPGSITSMDENFSEVKDLIFLDGESNLELGGTGGLFHMYPQTVYLGRNIPYRYGRGVFSFNGRYYEEANLKKVILGSHCRNLPERCFYNQHDLCEFYICGGPIEVNDRVVDFDLIFDNVPVTCNFYIPEGYGDSFKNDTHWNRFPFYHEGLEYEPTFATAHEFNKVFILTSSVKRWEYSRDGGLSWTKKDWISNIFLELDPEPGEVLYRVLQEDGSYSDIVSVTYLEAVPNEIATFPNSLTKTVEESVTFSVDNSSSTFSYQWYHNGEAIENATSETYTIESIKCSHAGKYYCNVYNAISSTNSSEAELVVNKASQLIIFPEIVNKRYGDQDFYLPEKTDKGLTIVYQSTNNNVATIENNKVHICGLGETIIIASQPGNEDYLEADQVTRKLIVKGHLQTIVWDELPVKTYEDAPFSLPKTTDKGINITYTSSNTNVATISDNVVTIVGAGTCEITANAPGNSTYDAAETVTHTLVVNRQTQHITLPDVETIEYGSTPIMLNQYTDKNLKILYSCSNGVAQIDNYKLYVKMPGKVTITAYHQGNNNYEPVKISKELTVVKGNQEIVWNDPLSFFWGDHDILLPETTNQGLVIEYQSANNEIVEVVGNLIKIKSIGTTQITAKQPGNSYYNSATTVIRTVTINKGKQIITLEELPYGTYGQMDHIQLYATTNSSSKIIFESSDQSIAQIDVDKIVVVGAGSCEIYAYAMEDEYYEASNIVKQTFVVKKADQTISCTPIEDKVYGDKPFVLNAQSSSGLPVTYVLSTSTPNILSVNGNEFTILNSGIAKIQVQQLGNNNYNAAVKDITITIGKASLTVTPINTSRLYGENNPDFRLEYEGFVNGDTDVVLSKSPIPNTIANVNSNVGEYIINVSGGESANYNLSYKHGLLTINKAPLTIKAEDKRKEYGDATPDFTLSYSGFRNNDTSDDLDQLPTISCNVENDSEPGVYPITLSGGTDNNYSYNLVNGVLTINEIQYASSITLDQSEISLEVAESAILVATILPELAINKAVTWSSSDESIATVDANGVVTAIAVGEATITATTVDGSNLSATCKVTVVPTLATSITLDKSEISLEAKETDTLVATVLPELATEKSVEWSSSDESIATVDANGVVTAIAVGEATITATTVDGSNLSATCKVTVIPTLATSITLDKTEISLETKETDTLVATIFPELATEKSVEWLSSDESIAIVDANGVVTAIAVGEATITATTTDGSNLSTTCKVTVIPTLAISIELDKTEASVEEKSDLQLMATILPEHTTNKEVAWSSSDKWVASVDNNGFVTVYAAGEAIITATTTDGTNLSATCRINVYSGIDGVNGHDVIVVTVGDNIIVKNAKLDSNVRVYAADGAMIASEVATDGDVVVETPIKGIYIVSVNGKTFKVMVK